MEREREREHFNFSLVVPGSHRGRYNSKKCVYNGVKHFLNNVAAVFWMEDFGIITQNGLQYTQRCNVMEEAGTKAHITGTTETVSRVLELQ